METSIELLLVGLSVCAIDICVGRLQGESMRQVGLVDVSCRNVLLAAPDLIEVGLPRLVRMKGHLIEEGEVIERNGLSAQPGPPFGQPV